MIKYLFTVLGKTSKRVFNVIIFYHYREKNKIEGVRTLFIYGVQPGKGGVETTQGTNDSTTTKYESRGERKLHPGIHVLANYQSFI